MRISRQEALDNHSRLVERNAVFRRCGYDADRSAAFILSHALPLSGKILGNRRWQGAVSDGPPCACPAGDDR